MKKTMILSLLGLMMLTETVRADVVKPNTSPDIGVWIKFNIIFHRPKFNCERGFGICILVTAGFEAPNGQSERAYCPVRCQLTERNQLVMEVEETALSKYENGTVLSNFKGRSSITIQDPYAIPEASCRALGSAKPLIIKPGTYPVLYKAGVYTVTFQL